MLWLDGSSEDSLNRSITSYAGRIPQGQIPEVSRTHKLQIGHVKEPIIKA